MANIKLRINADGNFSLTGNPDGSYDLEIDGVPTPIEQFVEHGRKGMKLWRNVMDGCKFLVVRRDGTIPEWPHFVMGARDPWAPAAMRAYAEAAEKDGAEPEYVQSLRDEATRFEEYRAKHGQGDPEAAPHRVDDPSIVQVMRDCIGGKVFIAAAWDKDQLEREIAKDE